MANDTIQLEDILFAPLMGTGGLAASRFQIDTEVLDADNFIFIAVRPENCFTTRMVMALLLQRNLRLLVRRDMNHADIIMI